MDDAIGTIKMHHTFNGAAPIERGWMICNGNIINQTNYDAIHGSGRYVRDQVAVSPIAGKYLPDMRNKYPLGSSTTTQTGSSAISTVGNGNHIVDISHNHKWYDSTGSTSTSDKSFASNGSPQTLAATGKSVGITGIELLGSRQVIDSDQYTDINQNTQISIQPESIEFVFKIKVI